MELFTALFANDLLAAVGIVLVSLVGAFAVEFTLRKTVGVMARKTATDLDDKVLDILKSPVIVTVVVIGVYFAAERVTPPDFKPLVTSIIQTAAIWVWARGVLRLGDALLEFASATEADLRIIQPETLPLFDILIKLVVVGATGYFGFLAWSIDVTAWLASAGIVGIAVGFAAKDTLANLFSGLFILIDRPYKIGDWIVLSEDNIRGEVTRIGVRSTRILTRDDIEITVPNAVIGGSKIINEAGGPAHQQRLRVPVEVAYGSDVDHVRKVLTGSAIGVAGLRTTPAATVRFRAFGASGLAFELMVWIENPSMRGLILDQLNTQVYKAFAKEGIEIPFSKNDLYIKEFPER